MQARKKKWNLSKAYSLIEVCFVLAILSLLVMITVPSFNAFNNQLADVELRKLSTFIQFCSYRAMMTNTQQTIFFDTIENAYYCGNYKEQLGHGIQFGVGENVYGPPSNPAKPISKAITFSDQRLIIHPNGTMQSGSVYITNKNKSTTYAMTTPVGAVSYIRLYRYDGHSWQLLGM